MFCPGSQISDKPLKDISHLMHEPQKFKLIKLDKVRGNACVSRREIISSFKKEDKIMRNELEKLDMENFIFTKMELFKIQELPLSQD